MVVAYFHPMRMTYLILAGQFFPGNIKMVKARQTLSSFESIEQDGRTFCPLSSQQQNHYTMRKAIEFMNLWVYFSRPKVPSWIWIRCVYSATYRNAFMSPLTFAMSTATRNFAQTFSYFIPPNTVEDHNSSLSHCYRTTLMADYIIPVLIQQQSLCYDCSDANHAQTPSCLIPFQFCLSILETFIPHSKIYGTSNYWQHAKCLLITF